MSQKQIQRVKKRDSKLLATSWICLFLYIRSLLCCWQLSGLCTHTVSTHLCTLRMFIISTKTSLVDLNSEAELQVNNYSQMHHIHWVNQQPSPSSHVWTGVSKFCTVKTKRERAHQDLWPGDLPKFAVWKNTSFQQTAVSARFPPSNNKIIYYTSCKVCNQCDDFLCIHLSMSSKQFCWNVSLVEWV